MIRIDVRPLVWMKTNGKDGVWWWAENPLGGLPYEASTEEEKIIRDNKYRNKVRSLLTIVDMTA